MMVDGETRRSRCLKWRCGANALNGRHIDRNENGCGAMIVASGNHLFDPREEEQVLLYRVGLCKYAMSILSQSSQSMAQGKLGTEAVAIGVNMTAYHKIVERAKALGDFGQRGIRLRGRHLFLFA